MALPQQARVLLRHRARRRRWSAASTRPAASTRSCRSTTACSRPSAATPPASRSSPGLASRGSSAWDRRAHEGFLRNLVVREGRRTGDLQVRLVTSPGELDAAGLAAAVDCDGLFWTQMAQGWREHDRRPPGASRRRRAAARADRRARVPDLARRVLPDQHGDGRAPVRDRGRVRRAARDGARLRPLLRHRHDRAVAGRACPRGRRRRDRRAGRGGRDRQRAPQRDHERRVLRRRHPARHARSRRARRTPRRRRRSTRRGPASRRRSSAGSSRRLPSGSSTCPATRRRWRRTPRSSPRRATRSSASARSTCSRRRRTSSASRCSSARRSGGLRPVRGLARPGTRAASARSRGRPRR